MPYAAGPMAQIESRIIIGTKMVRTGALCVRARVCVGGVGWQVRDWR